MTGRLAGHARDDVTPLESIAFSHLTWKWQSAEQISSVALLLLHQANVLIHPGAVLPHPARARTHRQTHTQTYTH